MKRTGFNSLFFCFWGEKLAIEQWKMNQRIKIKMMIKQANDKNDKNDKN